uniref:Protein kinase domain-containing protein n=1 Tax=Oryzias latipes TaxID=8090 RepID=A0A3P9I9T1_ORYLA
MDTSEINMFDDDSLLDWTEIDKGGFGSVYKARHRKMGHDVAIKILHDASLLKEATFQKVFSCNFVLRVYGMYKGIPPNEKVKQKGIVMEFMTRGSIMDLCKNLRGPPPFPLACRLIQEVASGMRFLHSMGILHRDLKIKHIFISPSVFSLLKTKLLIQHVCASVSLKVKDPLLMS